MMGGTGETKIGKKHMEILLADLLISLLEVDEEEKTEMETFLEKYPFTALLREYPVLGLPVETERKLEQLPCWSHMTEGMYHGDSPNQPGTFHGRIQPDHRNQ